MAKDPIALAIKDILAEKGLVQCAVAQRAGFSANQFSNMLHDRQIIKAAHLIPISAAMGVTPGEIYAAGEKYTAPPGAQEVRV